MKQAGKLAVTALVTVTAPIWVFPYVLCWAVSNAARAVHQALWGDE